MTAMTGAQVGDDVMHSLGGFRGEYERAVITRTTATRVYITRQGQELAFSRRDGRLIGASTYSSDRVEPWNDSHQSRVDETQARRVRDWLRHTDFGAVPLPVLLAVRSMLAAAGAKP